VHTCHDSFPAQLPWVLEWGLEKTRWKAPTPKTPTATVRPCSRESACTSPSAHKCHSMPSISSRSGLPLLTTSSKIIAGVLVRAVVPAPCSSRRGHGFRHTVLNFTTSSTRLRLPRSRCPCTQRPIRAPEQQVANWRCRWLHYLVESCFKTARGCVAGARCSNSGVYRMGA